MVADGVLVTHTQKIPEEEGGNAILIEVFSPLRDKSVLENGTVAASHLLFLDSPFYSTHLPGKEMQENVNKL